MEYLFNTRNLCKHGIIVSDMLKQYGGYQGIIVNGITVPFEIIQNNTLSFTHRAPTKNCIEKFKIHWISTRMSDQHIDKNPLLVL